jgi:hypothetical protein
MKQFQSDKTSGYIGTIVASILTFGVFFAIGALEFSFKMILFAVLLVYTLHRLSMDDALYVITIEGSTMSVNKKRFLLPPKEYSLKFDEINEIVITWSVYGSDAVWFRLYTDNHKYLFKICNKRDIIEELVDVFKEKKIKIVDKNKPFS